MWDLSSKTKGVVNALIHRVNHLLLWVRVSLQKRLKLLNEYQPDPFDSDDRTKSERLCRDRYEAFAGLVTQDGFSYLDIGCNNGYFTFKLVGDNDFGIGVDGGRNEIMMARAMAELNGITNVTFAQHRITPDNVNSLPEANVIICMSVFHHFVRHYGKDSAMLMLSTISRKARNFLVFDTGQPNEDAEWADRLSFMGNAPNEWIERMLCSYGFNQIHDCGKWPTGVSDIPRYLVVAEK